MTITKERLLKIQHWRETYGAGTNVMLPAEEAEELARIALASMEAKPVAWECGENIILFNPDTVEAYAKRAEISPKPLFAAPPAPVVPDDLRRAFEAVARLNNEMYRWTSCMSYNGSYVGEPEGLLKRNIREIEHIMDSCCASMLNGGKS